MRKFIEIKEENKEAIVGYLNRFIENDRTLEKVMRRLTTIENVYLIGGALRDLNMQRIPRDFDLISSAEPKTFHETMTEYSSTKNAFGGYKIKSDGFVIDIWNKKENWAYKTGVIGDKDEEIVNGAFFTIDACMFELRSKRLFVEGYNEAIRSNTIDIVLDEKYIEKNTKHVLNVLRALVFRTEYGFSWSDSVENYVKQWIQSTENPTNEIMREALRHYGYWKKEWMLS